jgi:hypothetical protein
MQLELSWHPLLLLRSGARDNLIFRLDELDELPKSPGIYVFGRKMGGKSGKSFVPVYIGQAMRLRERIRRQLNNLKLMMALKSAPGRRSYLAIGELVEKPRQDPTKALNIIEKTLIEYALADGYDIVNIQGTRRPYHTLSWSGRREGRVWLPRVMTVERRAR